MSGTPTPNDPPPGGEPGDEMGDWIDGLINDDLGVATPHAESDPPIEARYLNNLIDDDLEDVDFDVFADEEHLVGAGIAGAAGGARLGPGPAAGPASGPTLTPPPPTAPSAPRRLVRDPNSRFGGVASGLAHYMGVDVVWVRLVIVVATLMSGIGFVAYPLAWLIIPRAKVWPPLDSVSTRSGRGSGALGRRELGLALAVVALLVAFSSSDGPSQVLAPLVLLGSGVWLLRQPSASAATVGAAASTPPVGEPITPNGGGVADTYGQLGYAAPVQDTIIGQQPLPVPQRSRFRQFVRAAVIFCFVAIPLGMIGIVAAVVSFGSSDGFDATFGDFIFVPSSPAELLPEYSATAGEVLLDLTYLTPEMFDAPQVVDIKLSAGELTVAVPNGFPVMVDAKLNAGDLTVFDYDSEGLNNWYTFSDDDPVLILNVNGAVGDFTIERREALSGEVPPIPFEAVDPAEPFENPEPLEQIENETEILVEDLVDELIEDERFTQFLNEDEIEDLVKELVEAGN